MPALLRVGLPRQTVHAIRDSARDPDVRGRLSERLGEQPIDFLFINGDRSYKGVAA